MKIIGISGIGKSGKTTVANILSAIYGYRKIELGDGPKAAFKDLDGPGLELSKEEPSRPEIQTLGTEMREELGIPDHWIDYAKIKILYCYKVLNEDKFVIPSVRYINEYQKLKQWVESLSNNSYLQIKMERNVAGLPEEYSGHSSELEVDAIPYDHVIKNNGRIEQLIPVLNNILKCQ